MDIQPDFASFQHLYDCQKPSVVWTQIAADLDTPVSIKMKLAHQSENSFLLESVRHGRSQTKHRDRYSVIGLKPDLIWRCHGETAEICRTALTDNHFIPQSGKPLEHLKALIAESEIQLPQGLPPMAAGLFGYLGYDMIRHVEYLPNINPDILQVPDAILTRPTIIAIIDSVTDLITFITPCRPDETLDAQAAYQQAKTRLSNAIASLQHNLPRQRLEQTTKVEPLTEIQCNFTPDEYREAVEKAKEYIRAGDIFQVVPSQRWTCDFKKPPFSLYRALRRTNPSPYMFYFNFGGFQIVGASPEILVQSTDRRVTVRPIAGTRPRGENDVQDRAYEADLLADPKEISEHLMLLDLGRNDVGRVSEIGTVRPTEEFTVEYYSHVMHIVSNVQGTLQAERSPLDALLAGMPAGTVSGAPKVRAMEIIDELEPEKRGVYAGGVGYFSANGDMDFCIALRSAVIKDETLYIQAGGGVVYDSVPESERQETINKSKALMRAAELAGQFISSH